MAKSLSRLERSHGLKGNEKKEAFLLGERTAFQIMQANKESSKQFVNITGAHLFEHIRNDNLMYTPFHP